ncbi:MAG TPA: FCD domain-containing protein, partial [Lachnospiraceae bacterium]|nr:FCD domain-containing protein [Lachnospiraceae bacterium]
MQVSRAVVNAGITELARKGFLMIKPRVGTFVADYRINGTLETLISIMNYNGGILREAEIRSILELRIALDTLAVELSIPKITDDEIAVLKEYVKQLEETDSPEIASELSFRFQHELAILSGNTLMPLIFSSFKVPILSLWERFC